MDPSNADMPCIVQALASMDPNSVDLPCIVQALTALSPSPPPKTPRTPNTSRPPLPPSPRRTRSGGAPEWSASETLALVAAVAAVDDGWARSISAFQKWTIVADNLASSEATATAGGGSSRRRGRRASGECRRRWEALAAEYGAVRRWEVRTGGRYWEMGAAARRKAGLPAEFDAEVYGIMDALMRVEEALLPDAGGACGRRGEEVGEGLDGSPALAEEEEGAEIGIGEDGDDEEAEDYDNEGEMQVDGGNDNASHDLGCKMETSNESKKSQIDVWELANKLNDNAQHIHKILMGEVEEEAGQNQTAAYGIIPDAVETTRQKADELIKSLGGLVGYLNQFTDLIKENGFEDVVGMS